jgi:hypothetical protein
MATDQASQRRGNRAPVGDITIPPFTGTPTPPYVPAGRTTDPGATDDASKGYGIGMTWTNDTTDITYVLVDNTVDAAVWRVLPSTDAAIPLTLDDEEARKDADSYTPGGPLVGVTRVIQADLIGILWILIAADVTLDASWIGLPYTVDPDGDVVFNMQLKQSLIGFATSTRMNPDAALGGYSGLAVTNLHIGTAATSIAASAFYECLDIGNLHIPGNITAIGNGAFQKTAPGTDSTETITFEEGLLSIGSYAFYYVSNANFTTLVLPDSLLTIDDHAFNSWGYSSLASVTLGSGLTSIGEYSFANLLITSITFPDGLETIGYHSFDSCSLAGDLVIPDSVTSIGDYAFAYCSSLDDVYTSIPFADFPALALSSCGAGNLYVHADQVGDYGGTHGSKTVLTWDNYPDPTPN